ncbi:hypothetical protein M8C21_028931 [Ambrosia artemisiifolia]|uniref:Uncharacterized protein n=1 Tax=Ambrosia artemisiifolia TaxID=4212 RepID=A0AAD5GPK1_AMBAR|nr:hypothetical protein M8C21_028931 [Ambrosia artemisiifolia]
MSSTTKALRFHLSPSLENLYGVIRIMMFSADSDLQHLSPPYLDLNIEYRMFPMNINAGNSPALASSWFPSNKTTYANRYASGEEVAKKSCNLYEFLRS